ncbi:hypothetical protein F8S09_14845 [Deinococcus sp. SDU3-2]|uniref:Uncharacterized protein n=1 Tax=Deinococcus terrestris TaxID=2651870 RepID=A0A7X1NY36_9DEIO|nr:hypothetical protein [Deinococcus terrestris]MPY67937.1 hypothetical protein [Deinococcus terrestris]
MKKPVAVVALAALITATSVSAAQNPVPMYNTVSTGSTENEITPQAVPAAAAAAVGVQLVRAAAAAGVFTVFSEGVKNLSEAYKNFSKGSIAPEMEYVPLSETVLD